MINLSYQAKGLKNMLIRKATFNDLPQITEIYAAARIFMAENGNKNQWGNIYPPIDVIENDIKNQKLYLCIEDNHIACVFYFAVEADPTYSTVYDGAWLNHSPYGVVHRVASSHIVKGAARFCLNWAFDNCGNLKIDTHRDNIPMQKLLSSLGFKYCGIIHLESGDERLAYQKEA